ncbi:MAG: tetratricopeptide repeat protein [Bdellovibrionales bacterium]|jgi:tetratricopeptide (TPR) repeat protein
MSPLDEATELHNQGRLADAERLYRAILATDPNQPDALALLGVLLASRKEYAQATPLLEKAIQSDPSASLFHFYLGNIFLDMGKDERAETSFRAALALQPNFANAHFRLALLLEKQNKFSEALQHLRKTTEREPKFAAAWVKLSELSFKIDDYELAKNSAEMALRQTPNDLAAHVALALALDSLDKEEDAVAPLKKAIQLKPDFVEAWDMLASTYQKLNKLDEADKTFHKSIEIAGCALKYEDSRDVAEVEYGIQHWNLAILELLRGDFRHGFAHYRARFKKIGRNQRLSFPRPIWNGEDLQGKKILIVGEQGFGDVLMLCRFAPFLKAKGARVVLLAHRPLAKLLKAANIADEIICEAPSAQGDFDYQTSIFDLPFWLDTKIETIPDKVYLPSPRPDASTKLPRGKLPKIGVVWAGKKEFGNDRRRSIPLSVFASVLTLKNVQFFNLTRDLRPGDADILAKHSVVDLSSLLNDFYATAQFMAQMDLIITCDTATAHLAGGMGKNVWTLLPFAPDWRWLTEREDSPWYASMWLFRQNKKADWAGVIARVRAELARFIAKK